MINMRALIDSRAYFHPCAHYYRMFSWDRAYYAEHILVEPRKVTRVAFRSIADLLRALRRYGQQGESHFLIVSHGNPRGLPIRIRANNVATINVDIMDSLSEALGGDAAGRRFALSYADNSGRRVFQNEGQLNELLGLIRDVRQLRIEHIEFRGCNIGAGPALRAIHQLLGARLTAAPRVGFIWSRLPTAGVHGTPDWLQTQIGSLPPVRRLFTRIDCLSTAPPAPDRQIVFALSVIQRRNDKAFQLLALNSHIIKGWTQSYLQNLTLFATSREPAGGGYRRGGFLPLIGFDTPNHPRYPFVFPGDAFDYTGQIAHEMAPGRWVPPIP